MQAQNPISILVFIAFKSLHGILDNWNWFSHEHVQLMVIHILVYQNVLKFVNFLKTQSPIGVFFCNTSFGWNKRTKKLDNFYLEIFNEILYILLEHNKLSFITFNKICGNFLFWFDAHIYNLWEYILVKEKKFFKLFVGVHIELIELHLCKVVYIKQMQWITTLYHEPMSVNLWTWIGD